jgi:hypothetical protein
VSNRDGYGATASRDAWAHDGFAPLPGDIVTWPDDQRGTVATVYLCAETSGEDATRWTWAALADGRLLEVAPRGCALYEPPLVLERGTVSYFGLVAQDGALVRFEERVRAGTWATRPVRLTLERRRWRVTSTGTATAQRLGPLPAGGWGQLGLRAARSATPTNGRPAGVVVTLPSGVGEPGTGAGAAGSGLVAFDGQPAMQQATEPDVYFTLAETGEATGQGIGLWATDVCVAFGRRLGDTPTAAGLCIVGRDGPDTRPSAPDLA